MMMQKVAMSRVIRVQTARVHRVPATHTRKVRYVAAKASSTAKPAIAEFADNIGLPTEEGLFGFKPFSEVWCGRLAMMGFVTSIAIELQTGKGTLAQLNIQTPSTTLLVALISFVGVATLGAAGYTAFLGVTGKLSAREAGRYKQFLLLDREDEIIESMRSESTVADKFLAVQNDEQDINAARQALTNETSGEVSTASTSETDAEATNRVVRTPRTPSYEDIVFNNAELRYARTVETDNGRAAMLGFLAAILVEAGTGKGIILQLIMWFKFMGLLGSASGF